MPQCGGTCEPGQEPGTCPVPLAVRRPPSYLPDSSSSVAAALLRLAGTFASRRIRTEMPRQTPDADSLRDGLAHHLSTCRIGLNHSIGKRAAECAEKRWARPRPGTPWGRHSKIRPPLVRLGVTAAALPSAKRSPTERTQAKQAVSRSLALTGQRRRRTHPATSTFMPNA